MNIAFYPYWAAKTLLSFVHVIYITVITIMIYGLTASLLWAFLFPIMQVAVRSFAGLSVSSRIKHFACSRLMIGMLATKTLLLSAIAAGLPYLKQHIPILFAAAFLLSLLEGWESALLHALPWSAGHALETEIAKANSLLSFSSHTATVVGLPITFLATVHWGAASTLWSSAALSWTTLVFAIAFVLLIQEKENTYAKRASKASRFEIKQEDRRQF